MLKAIHAQESKRAAREKAKAVVEELRSMKLKETAKKMVFVLGHLLTSRFLLFYHRSKAKNAI